MNDGMYHQFAINSISKYLDNSSTSRTRLIWLVGSYGSGKTKTLRQAAQQHTTCAYINLNLSPSLRLQTESFRQRPFVIGRQLSELLPAKPQGAWLVDNIELLFSRTLKIQVVDVLKSVAQRVPLVVAWPGKMENGRLIYGERKHPDYREFSIDSLPYVDINELNLGQ